MNYLCNKRALLYLGENKAMKPLHKTHVAYGTLGHHLSRRTCPIAPVCGHTHSLACYNPVLYRIPVTGMTMLLHGYRPQRTAAAWGSPSKVQTAGLLGCSTCTSSTLGRPLGTGLWLCCLPAKDHPCAGQSSEEHGKRSPNITECL